MTPPTEPRPERAPKERRVRLILDRALSASAGFVAVTALVVSVYQAYISREQQKMSAWPYVTQSNTGSAGYARLVQNVGLGPALVRSMRIYVDGKPVPDWGVLLTTMLHTDSASLRAMARDAKWTQSSVRPGMVLLPGSTTELVRVEGGTLPETLRRVLNDDRLSIRVCYCSLYKDCWLSDSKAMEPTEVRACPALDPALEFQS